LFVIPVIQVCFIVFSILLGGLFFEEFDSFTVTQFVGFIVGVLLIVVGVYGLAPDNELDFFCADNEAIVVEKSTETVGIMRESGIRLTFTQTIIDKGCSNSFGGDSKVVPEANLTEEVHDKEKSITTLAIPGDKDALGVRQTLAVQGIVDPTLAARRSGKLGNGVHHRGSMVHPLAALKELHRKADETKSLAPVVRASRRFSFVLFVPSIVEGPKLGCAPDGSEEKGRATVMKTFDENEDDNGEEGA
jgi:hypothetical protein